MINKEEVKHIAKLARIGLTESEIKKFQKELSSILDYIEKLKEVDVSGKEPTPPQVFPGKIWESKVENVMREDKAPTFVKTTAGKEKLLKLAPETKDGYLKVKSIIKLPFMEAKSKKRA